MKHMADTLRCGLVGHRLGHSFSPIIHRELADYSYDLFELENEELEAFFKGNGFDGVNVTIPYKKAAMEFCHSLTDIARRIGCVNTVRRLPDGSLLGHNTDYDGFLWMLRSTGYSPAGKKALVLGTGGASLTVNTVLHDMGASEVINISRGGADNYENMYRHSDAALLVNATPVGMYPNNGDCLVELHRLPGLECVLDVVYNPARTELLLQSERLNIKCENGLGMLVAQAVASSQLFLGRDYDTDEIDRETQRILSKLRFDTMNILLVGMPGSGKSSVGRAVAALSGREFFDADEELVKAAGISIPEIFAKEGEEGFRRRETLILRELSRKSSAVIAAGGGAVTRAENLPLLRQNSNVLWLQRELSELATEGRPLSAGGRLEAMYEKRAPLYEKASVCCVVNDGSVEQAARAVITAVGNACGLDT